MRDAKGDRQKCAFGEKRKNCIFGWRVSMTHPCVADLESIKEQRCSRLGDTSAVRESVEICTDHILENQRIE